jgi:acyl-CoA dehydrogenase
MPFSDWVMNSYHIALADGPTEVHKVTVAREVLKEYEPTEKLFPDYHLPAEQQRALDLYGDLLDDLSATG